MFVKSQILCSNWWFFNEIKKGFTFNEFSDVDLSFYIGENYSERLEFKEFDEDEIIEIPAIEVTKDFEYFYDEVFNYDYDEVINNEKESRDEDDISDEEAFKMYWDYINEKYKDGNY